jgi:hypothetical protein
VRANVIGCCFSASVAVVFDQDVRVVSCLVCQRQFSIEENARDMVVRSRVIECAWSNSFVNWFLRVWLQCPLFLPSVCRVVFLSAAEVGNWDISLTQRR